MAEWKCQKNIWEKHCDYSGWKTINNKKLMIWPPSACLDCTKVRRRGESSKSSYAYSFYKKLKEYYGITYLTLNLIECLEDAALDAGWEIKDIALFVDAANKYGYGGLEYHVRRMYEYQRKHNRDVDQDLYAFIVDEPFQKNYGWINWDKCPYYYHTWDRCECIRRMTVDYINEQERYNRFNEDDKLKFDLFQLAEWIHNRIDDDKRIVRPPNRTKLIVNEYDNSWLLGGSDPEHYFRDIMNQCQNRFIDAVACDHYSPMRDITDYWTGTNEWDIFKKSGTSGNMAWISLGKDYEKFDDRLHNANNVGFDQLNLIGTDEDFSSCDDFLKHLDEFMLYAQKRGWVERIAYCYPKLIGERLCKYKDCNLCSDDNPDDWITILFSNTDTGFNYGDNEQHQVGSIRGNMMIHDHDISNGRKVAISSPLDSFINKDFIFSR